MEEDGNMGGVRGWISKALPGAARGTRPDRGCWLHRRSLSGVCASDSDSGTNDISVQYIVGHIFKRWSRGWSPEGGAFEEFKPQG